MLEFFILGTSDNLVLELLCHIVEVVRVACYTNEEVLVVLWGVLGIEESLSIYDVELDVVTTHREV